MNYYAKVTLHDGKVLKPVGVWVGGSTQGVRFYRVAHGRVALLAAAPGLVIESFGEREKRVPGQPKPPLKPAVFRGLLPADFAKVEYLATCACGSPLKRFVAPNEWEVTTDA